jgi:hypothetical protein
VTESGGLTEGVRRLAVGVVSGLGLLGFVTVVGGAIEWTRFDALGLPADQAVAAIPKQQLLTVGAWSVVVFVLAGAIAVGIAYAIDRQGQAAPRMAAYLGGLVVLGFVATLVVDMRSLYVAVLTGIGAALAAVTFWVAWATKARFLGFGLAVVVCVAAFGGAFAYFLNRGRPQAQAVAVLAPGGGGLTGIFVARDERYIWIGRAKPQGLVVIPCKGVSAIAIGRVQPRDPEPLARKLLARLRADRAQLRGGATDPTLC